MPKSKDEASGQADIREGGACLLNVLEHYFMVRITKIDEDGLHVTFPAADYPAEGMSVYLDFHDEDGLTRYRAKVLRGPRQKGDGLLLDAPDEGIRTAHRDFCRVPTDLTVQVKDHEHVRLYDADLLNLSAGGALIRTSAPFDYTTQVDIILSLPGEVTLQLRGGVVHLADAPNHHAGAPTKDMGLHFVSLDAGSLSTLTRFVNRQMKGIYP